jgi:hypothetical protein
MRHRGLRHCTLSVSASQSSCLKPQASCLGDVLYAVDLIVTPNRPRAIVLYEGDNDLARGKSPRQVVEEYGKLVRRILGKRAFANSNHRSWWEPLSCCPPSVVDRAGDSSRTSTGTMGL